ncbi:MAG: HlyC/CorC family transporter [Bacteroidales bacterium]|nr:HlyC/CorC family transporter [Bacteroidales bacterium]MBN2821479.1 HlyC/CorC family transporter [Bacteroidales bacterium]
MSSSAIILITLLFSAFFSGMEIAFISSNKLRIELDRKQGKFSSKIISLFTNNPSQYLTAMLVGNNIALVVYGLVMADEVLEPFLQKYIQSALLVLLIQTMISTVFILVTAEFLPKMIFRNIPNASLNIMAVPLFIFYSVFYPLTLFINTLTESILRGIKKEGEPEVSKKNVFNKVDLVYFINQTKNSEEQGPKTNDEIKLFQNALDFSSVKIRDCMVPRPEIIALEENTPFSEIQKTFVESGFSKIPIYKDNIDNIIGYVTSKSLFSTNKDNELRLIEVSYVPETMSANRLLKKLIQDKKSLAVVVDEFGGVSGMLTIEDIIEEIFGEIEDEHDTSALIEKQISDQEFIFSGRLEIDHLNETYNLKIPENEEYETIAGYIIDRYESIPKLHERITTDQFEIEILKASKTKIELIHLRVTK